MNSLERIIAAVGFRPVDRVPVIAQVFGHAAVLAGAPLDKYLRSGETLARCQLRALQRYGYDAVFSVMGAGVETEAAGSVLEYFSDRYPVVRRYALDDGEEPDRLAVPDPESDGRMPEMLGALKIMRRELKDEVLVVGCVVGPFTLVTQLVGIEKSLFLLIDDPVMMERLLDFATRTVIRFGKAQIRAGAHLVIVFDPSSSSAVLPPQVYADLVSPRLLQVSDAFREAGAAANWIHVAGPSAPILGRMPAAGFNIVNFDYCVSPEAVAAALPKTCVDGNVRSLAFVEEEPAAIAAAAAGLVETFGERGGFILSSGCEIPPESRPENVAALTGAVRAE